MRGKDLKLSAASVALNVTCSITLLPGVKKTAFNKHGGEQYQRHVYNFNYVYTPPPHSCDRPCIPPIKLTVPADE